MYQAILNRRQLLVFLGIFLWFLFYTYYSQIISGTVALLFGLSALLFLQLYHTRRKLSLLFAGALVLIPIALVAWSFSLPFKSPITKKDLSTLPVKTVEGNEYIHYFVNIKDSKGNYIFINLCEIEIEREWNKVSAINYRGIDKKGQMIRFTLMRYMTSKGLKKDAKDFKKLGSEEIKKIENGIAEYEDGKTGLIARINGIRYQLLAESDPNGHSLLQRFEYWKAGWNILKENFLFGVGTGDLQVAFNKEYERSKSKLFEENRLRAHNTYLTVWISFGVFSLLFFYLLWKFTGEMIKRKDFIGFAFIVIALGSFLIEDTLETQTGVTFFAFFYGLFLRNSASIQSVES